MSNRTNAIPLYDELEFLIAGVKLVEEGEKNDQIKGSYSESSLEEKDFLIISQNYPDSFRVVQFLL